MELSWLLKVGIGMFLTAWVMCVIGWAVNLVEWRRFRTGHPAGARRGIILSSRIASRRVSGAEALARFGVGRPTGSPVLLFPLDLPYANSLHPCRVFWFGRAVVDHDQVRVEARVPVGAALFVLAWFTMAILMAVILAFEGVQLGALVIGTITMVAALGYRYTFLREREAAERFVIAFASTIEKAA